jgi:prolyl-tRNA synthetase
VHVDDRENHNPGFKFNHWELRGVPICVHLGMSEVENNELTVSLRHQGTGKNSPTHVIKMDGLVASIEKTMVDIHNAMF